MRTRCSRTTRHARPTRRQGAATVVDSGLENTTMCPEAPFMAIREIVTYPEKILAEKSQPVKAIDDEIRKLLDDMPETMYAAPGIGLAAIQVGVPLRVVVIDLQSQDEPQPVGLE